MATMEPKMFDRFRHYKGGEYTFIHKALHTETGETMIIYTDGNAVYARPSQMFFGMVDLDGVLFPRFRRINQ